jgi:predicted NUDIX family phosphoesterase
MWRRAEVTDILVIPAAAMKLPAQPAAWPLLDSACLRQTCWREREPCETDETWLQLIPYVVLRNPAGKLWCYRRTGGDSRLLERRSCGLGGHVERDDQAEAVWDVLNNCAQRELDEELIDTTAVGPLQPQAWIYEGETPIGRVHLGILFVGDWHGPQPPRIAEGEPMENLAFHQPEDIIGDDRFENWSRLVAGRLAGYTQP